MPIVAQLTPLVRWRLEDDTVGDFYEFEVNPNEGGTPDRRKSISYQRTVAPDGKAIIFEGQDEALQSTFAGVYLTAEQHAALIAWFKRRHVVKLIDDLGREFIIYITGLSAKRQRAVHYAYKHQYNLDYTIIEEL